MLFLLGVTCCQRACAKEYRNGFNDDKTSWQLKYKEKKVKTLAHRRSRRLTVEGRASELVQLEVRQRGAVIEMTHKLPPARVIEDLKLTLSFRSNRGSAQLFLRVVFPHQKDSRTGAVLSTWVQGSTYSKVNSWEQLECTTTRKKMNGQIQRLYAKLNNRGLDFHDAFVDQAVIVFKENVGAVEYIVDQLQFGPIVDAQSKQAIAKANTKARYEESFNTSGAELRLGTMYVKNQPFFPRIAPYHNEEISQLKQTGLNTCWISDYQDRQLISDLKKVGISSTAVPPRATSRTGKILPASNAGLPPFGKETSSILFWMFGQHVSPRSKQDVKSWAQQIHQADRNYSRPIMIDVSGDERFFSQHVSMLGVSRHVSNTTLPYKEYRDWIISRRRLARPGSFAWTWIQTEPNSTQARHRYLTGRSPVVIEPEQIRLQVYSALSAGCRGIGYWKTYSLDGKAEGATERKLVISQLNREIGLVEEWLATGNVVAQVPFQIGNSSGQKTRRNNVSFRRSSSERQEQQSVLREQKYQTVRNRRLSSELEATIIRGESGLLLLPVWYGKGAQFCPGKMTANDVSIVVPGVDESAIAWEVTTTSVRSLPRERVTGGIRITLKKFDLTTMIILTSDRQLVARLKSRVAKIAKKSAKTSIDLAQEKYLRVKQIHTKLQQQGIGQVDASQLLAQARGLLKRAGFYYTRNDFNSARLLAADTMQSLRILQRAYWNDAVRSLSSPVSSPHAISFQTLPDHWKMIARLGRSEIKNDNNLLRSGDFEDIDTMTVEHWKHAQNHIEGVQATAELYPQSQKGKYSLRLIAVPKTGASVPRVLSKSPVLVSTPPMDVRSGQIVHISGWVKVVSRTVSGTDGLMIYDSLGGVQGAIRWKKQGRWKHFEFVREVSQTGSFHLTIALTGLGEILVDQLQVIPHNPRTFADAAASKPKKTSRLNARDLWNRLPSLPRPEFPEFPPLTRPQMPDLRSLNPLFQGDTKRKQDKVKTNRDKEEKQKQNPFSRR
ncbi:FIG00927013: hypothetical protein [hydrothermal vent metagenome]|uniref:Uncharacterized protein n=1 Tax=hydrothermal vent metagenome TaxID=652676 RepID=A0A3B1DX67_9ZZZZ